MKVKKIILRMAISVAMMGLLAGCGSDAGSSQENATRQEMQDEVSSKAEGTDEATAGDKTGAADGVGTEGETDGVDVGSETDETGAADGADAAKNEGMADTESGTLIAYFSIPEDVDTSGVDAIAGASIVVKDSQVMGNTEYVAKLVQETIGGDLFRIETVENYPLDHDPLVDQAADEQDANLRPELASHIENLDQYDTIILGFPNWWGDFPMPLYSFLETYDFGGKTIIPFVTHGGSGFSDTQNTIARLQPNAVVSDNTLSLSRSSVADSAEEVHQWAESLGLNRK